MRLSADRTALDGTDASVIALERTALDGTFCPSGLTLGFPLADGADAAATMPLTCLWQRFTLEARTQLQGMALIVVTAFAGCAGSTFEGTAAIGVEMCLGVHNLASLKAQHHQHFAGVRKLDWRVGG